MLDINKLLDSYFSYFKNGFEVNRVDSNTHEIITPFLDRSNDNISVYAVVDKEKIILTDGGETLQNLRFGGLDINTPKKERELNTILNGFGIFRDSDSFYVEATSNDFAKKQNNIVQALLSINDMLVLTQDKVSSFFFEDVVDFFNSIDVRFSTNIILEGKSHFSHKFDFLISKSKIHKERLIKILNRPKRDNLQATLFTFMDLQEDRKTNSDSIIIFNDTNGIATDLLDATLEYNIKPIEWSKIEQNVELFAA